MRVYLLMGFNSTDLSRHQVLQSSACKVILQASKYDHASPLLRQLHWLPIKERILFKVMVYVYKCLAGSAPEYLRTCFELYTPRPWTCRFKIVT